MTAIKIVGLAGSFNPHASCAAALGAVLAGARAAGAEVESLDVRTLGLPHYDFGIAAPPAAHAFLDTVRSAHGMVWCSPLYHGSIAGAFKNTLDWLEPLSRADPPYLTDKVVALVATAGGEQALQAINTMEFIVRALRGFTLPRTAPIGRADEAFDEHGRPRTQRLATLLDAIGHELVAAVRRMTR